MFCYIGKVSVASPSDPNVSHTWLNWLKQTITIHPSPEPHNIIPTLKRLLVVFAFNPE